MLINLTLATKFKCVGVFSSLGTIILLFGLWWLRKVVRKKIAKKRKEKFFKQNGGLLLEQRLSSGEVNVDKIKLFSLKDLEKATRSNKKLMNYHIETVRPYFRLGNIVRDVLIIASRITVFDTDYSAKPGITLGFDQENKKIQGKGGKKVILWIFLDPSSPKLASGSSRL